MCEAVATGTHGRGTTSLDALVRAVTATLSRSDRREPHPAEVAALLFERIERVEPKVRELLLRSALVREGAR